MKEVLTQDVFIGRKPFHSYLAHVARMLSMYGSVRLYARGAAIPKAIDVAMIASRRESIGCRVAGTHVDTDTLVDKDSPGARRQVSTIAIDMSLDGPTIDLAGMDRGNGGSGGDGGVGVGVGGGDDAGAGAVAGSRITRGMKGGHSQ